MNEHPSPGSRGDLYRHPEIGNVGYPAVPGGSLYPAFDKLDFQRRNLGALEILVEKVLIIDAGLRTDVTKQVFRTNDPVPELRHETADDRKPERIVVDDVAERVQHQLP